MCTVRRHHIPDHVQTDKHIRARQRAGMRPILTIPDDPQAPIITLERSPSASSGASGPSPIATPPTPSTPLESRDNSPDPEPDEDTVRMATLWEDLQESRTIRIDPNEYIDLFEKVLQEQAKEAADGSQSQFGPIAGNGDSELPALDPSAHDDSFIIVEEDLDETGESYRVSIFN